MPMWNKSFLLCYTKYGGCIFDIKVLSPGRKTSKDVISLWRDWCECLYCRVEAMLNNDLHATNFNARINSHVCPPFFSKGK